MNRRMPLLLAVCLAPFLSGAADTAPAEQLSLGRAHEIALRNHPQVAMAVLRGMLARENLKQTQAAYLPEADAFVDGVDAGNRNSRILAGGLNNPSVYDRVAEGVQVSELITDFGRTSNLAASAKAQVKAADEDSAATNEAILLNVDASYFSALQAAAVLKVASDTVEARRLLERQVAALAANQLKSELDVSFAQVAVEESLLLLQRAQSDSESSLAGLSTALGYRETRRFVPTDANLPVASPPEIGSLVDTAIANRPDILRLRFEADAANRYARAQKAMNYPVLAVVGAAGNALSHDYRLPNRYAVGGVEVNIPLFAGGSYLAREREAGLQAQIAGESLRDREDDVARDVRVAWLNFNTAILRLRTMSELVRHANEAYALARARYRIGSSSIVELTDAQLSATSAQIGYANARFDELTAQSMLKYQMGTLK